MMPLGREAADAGETRVLGGLDLIALVIIDALKGRVRMIAIAFALLPIAIVALLAINAGEFAEDLPGWLLALIGTPLLVTFYLTLIVPAFRLGKPGSWWAQKYYDDEKAARATERFRGLYRCVILLLAGPPRLCRGGGIIRRFFAVVFGLASLGLVILTWGLARSLNELYGDLVASDTKGLWVLSGSLAFGLAALAVSLWHRKGRIR